MKIIWSPVALERVVEVGERIAHEQSLAAADWVSGIFEAVKKLGRSPAADEWFRRHGEPTCANSFSARSG